MAQKPSMSLILRYESAVIDATAKEAFPLVAAGCTDGSWTSTWFSHGGADRGCLSRISCCSVRVITWLGSLSREGAGPARAPGYCIHHLALGLHACTPGATTVFISLLATLWPHSSHSRVSEWWLHAAGWVCGPLTYPAATR